MTSTDNVTVQESETEGRSRREAEEINPHGITVDELQQQIIESIDNHGVRLSDDDAQNALKESDSNSARNLNNAYESLLRSYTDHIKVSLTYKRKMKAVFFIFSIALMSLLVLAIINCVVLFANNMISDKPSNIIDFLPALITGLVSFVTSIIIIPKVIAEHLFNHEEESFMIKIVEIIQSHDTSIRDNMKK